LRFAASPDGYALRACASPFIKPGTASRTPYNHYSSLASWESVFGLARLADAASVPSTFGADVYTAAGK
jgi:phosphatidylinositol-3-phosphatase